MHRYFFIAPLLIVTACGGHITKPNTSQAQMDKDTAACNYEMHKADVSSNTSDYGSAFRAGQLFNECMYQRGYVDVK